MPRQKQSEPLTAKIRLPDGRRFGVVGLWNISLGGLFVEVDEVVGFGQEVELETSLPQGHVLHCKGFVVWSTKEAPSKGGGRKGIGVRLSDIGIADMRLLAECVGRNLVPEKERV